MNRPTKAEITALIEQQKTTLDQLIKNQGAITKVADILYPKGTPARIEALNRLLQMTCHLEEARENYQHAAEKLEKIIEMREGN